MKELTFWISAFLMAVATPAPFVAVTSEPNIVQSEGAAMVMNFILGKEVAAGGYIRVTFPDVMKVSADISNCRDIDAMLVITSCTANTVKNYIDIELGEAITLPDGIESSAFEVQADNALTLPTTIASAEPVTLQTSAGEIRTTVFKSLQGELDQAELTPADQVVGSDTSLHVSLKLAHKIPLKGKIHISVNAAWNEGSPESPISYFSSINCQALVIGGVAAPEDAYSCSYQDNRVEIDGGFEEKEGEAGQLVSVYITGFRNPIQANHEYDVFTIFTTDENVENIIDVKDASVTVSKPAQLVQASLMVSPLQEENIGIVQEDNIMSLRFTSPVPLQPSCTVKYYFPTHDYDAAEITSVRLGAQFEKQAQVYYPEGSGNSPTFKIEEISGGVFKAAVFETCQQFRPRKSESTVIYGLSQPESTKPTSSLQVWIFDSAGNTIAKITKGLSFTAAPGSLTILSASIEPTVVQSQAMFTWSIKPDHALFGGDEMITMDIKYPSDFTVKAECQVETLDEFGTNRECSGDTVYNTVTVKNLIDDQTVPGGSILSFKVGPIQLPDTISGGKGKFTATTSVVHDDIGMKYAIDTGFAEDLFTITVGAISSAAVTPSTLNAYTKSDLKFEVTPDHKIPQYGLILVQYPSQLDIQDPSLSQTFCSDWSSFPSTTPVCSIFKQNRTIIVNKGFQSGEGGEGGSTTFSWIVPFFTNPATLLPTDSFSFQTKDQYFNEIDELLVGVTIKMDQPANLEHAEVDMGSFINSQTTRYTFNIVSQTQILDGNSIKITLPEECALPSSDRDLNCQSESTDYVNFLSCSRIAGDPQSVLIVLNLKQGIPELTTFQVSVNNIRNPSTTKPSQSATIHVYDNVAMDNILSQYLNNLIIITSVPYFIDHSTASLVQSVKGAGLDSVYTIKMKLAHSVDPNGGFLIRYPTQVLLSEDIEMGVEIEGSDYGLTAALTTAEIDQSARQIIMYSTEALTVAEDGDQTLTLTFTGLRNPMNNEESSSFEIVTFNGEGNVLYLIDQIVDGLKIKSQCNYPCKDCVGTNPSLCTKCYDDDNPFLQENTCLEKCSDGWFYDKFTDQCEKCHPTCLTCEGQSRICTTCGVEGYLHLRGTECVEECGPGFINDPSNNLCHSCKLGCETCSVSTDNCTSCQFGSLTPLYFDFSCYTYCPERVSVEKDDKCIPCDTKCRTCSESPSNCTSCFDYMRFDNFNFDCLEACKPNEQIYNTANGECDTCQENCLTCVGDVDTCTSCKDDFVLTMQSTCEAECGEVKQTPVDGKCKECEKPCATCDGATDHCKTCIGDLLLYKNTCVDHCPLKFQANNATVNQCILVGLICPEGFHINDDGEGCIPNEFECKEGYEINEKQTACIPAPGTPVLFPFFVMTICIGLVIAGSNMKDRKQTKSATIFIFLTGSMEILEYPLIAFYALALEKNLISLLAGIATLMLIASNITFSIQFNRALSQDKDLIEWFRHYPKTRIILPALCLLINFKFIRFILSGFYGLENCQAKFSDPYFSMHATLQRVTYFQNIFVYGSIFVADLLIISRTPWGHQLLVLAIETFVLQILVMYMTYKEFQEPDALYFQKSANGKKGKPRKTAQNAVRGTYGKDMDEDNLIRLEKDDNDYEIYLRKRALTLILQQVGHNFERSKKAVDIGGDIKKVFTKFDHKQIQLRRAFSTEDLTEFMRQNLTDGTKLDEEYDEEEEFESCIDSDDTQYEVLLHRRYSFPFPKQIDSEAIADKAFFSQVDSIRNAMVDDKYFDNCYAVPKKINLKAKKQHVRKKKMVNRRTQTYLRELLQVEGEPLQDSDMEVIMEDDPEIEENYTKGLIEGVIDCISESTAPKDVRPPERVPTEPKASSQKKKKHRNYSQPLQEFDLQDIVGEFEIDDMGNFMILRGDAGEMMDKRGRLVNKRGYLVDKMGNVVNQNEEMVFKFQDLDANQEIPAPYAFEKRKQNLLNLDGQFKVQDFGNGPGASKMGDIDSENEEDIVEKQFNRLKQGERMTSRSSESNHQQLAGDQQFMVDEHGNVEDDIVAMITKKTEPIKKSEHINTKLDKKSKINIKKTGKVQDGLFLGGQFQEQPVSKTKNLKKISEQVSGINNQDLMDESKFPSVIPEERGQPPLIQTIPQNINPMSDTSSVNKGAVSGGALSANFFMPTQINPDQNQSILSQDIVVLNEAMAARPGMKPPKKGQKDFRGKQPTGLKKVYGNIHEISNLERRRSAKREEFSPMAAQGQIRSRRPESSGMRPNQFADPKMRGLESIYLNKFQKGVGSQKNMINLKRPFQQSTGGLPPPKTRQTFLHNMGNVDQIHAQELNQESNQRQTLIAETIDRLQQEYLMQGVPPVAPTMQRHWYTEGGQNQASQGFITASDGGGGFVSGHLFHPPQSNFKNGTQRYDGSNLPQETEIIGNIGYVEEERPTDTWYNEEHADQ